MNFYFKHWIPKDVDPEVMGYYGIRFGRYHENKLKAWDVDIVVPNRGMYNFTFTTNHKKLLKFWGSDFKNIFDWQLFP